MKAAALLLALLPVAGRSAPLVSVRALTPRAAAPLAAVPARASAFPTGFRAAVAERSAAPLADLRRFLREADLAKGGYLLGVSGARYDRVAEATGLARWHEAYADAVGRVRSDMTGYFMERLTGSGQPVVFLLPARARAHPEANMTRAELAWLLERPEAWRSVRFVTGVEAALPRGEAVEAARARLAALRGDRPAPTDAARVAQWLTWRPGVALVEPGARADLLSEILDAKDEAPKLHGFAAGRVAFLTPRGAYAYQADRRGVFLEAPGRGAFVSRASDPALHALAGDTLGLPSLPPSR